ncbi:MAG TPA: Mpo1-like protein [Polyangiaceae bacterium]
MTRYAETHGNRKNLALHAATVPLFWAGTVGLVAAVPLGIGWFAGLGALAMIAAIGAQGRGHAREEHRPAPFRGPLDVLVRIFKEQWVTFPRFVASGGFSRAWTGCNVGR